MATPALVNHVAGSMDITPVGTLTIRFPDPVLANNCLVCFVQYSNTAVGSITSVKDNLGNSFTLGPTFTNATYHKSGSCYYLPNATSGVTYVQVTYAGLTTNTSGFGTGYPQADISQWNNIATATPVDTSASSSTSTSPGAMTTGTSGDLILHWAIDLSDNTTGPAFNGTSITKGSGYTLLTADLQVGSMVQYQVQGSAGAITPTCTVNPSSATWGSLAIALKSAAAGTAPSGSTMRIVNVYHCSFAGNLPGGVFTVVLNSIQFPCQGNLLVCSYQGEGAITSITDSHPNTWNTSNISVTSSAGNQTAQIAYAAAAVGSDSLSLTFAFQAGTKYALGVLYDVVNAASTSPYDTFATFDVGNLTSFSAATLSVLPNTSTGIIFNSLCVSWDTVNAITSPSGGILDTQVNSLDSNNVGTAGTAASCLDEDAGFGHYSYSSAASVTFTYSANTSGEAGGGTVGPGFFAMASGVFKISNATVSPPVVVQSSQGPSLGSGSTIAATFGSNTTTGNMIVVNAHAYDGATLRTVSSIAVTGGAASFSKIIAQTGVASTYPSCEGWAAASVTGGTSTVTVTFSGTVTNGDIFIYELSSMPSTVQSEGGTGKAGTSATACTAPAITTANPNDIIFACFGPSQNMTAGEGGSWVTLIGALNSTADDLSQYLIVSTTQSALVSTATQSSAGTYSSIVYALKGMTAASLPSSSTNPKLIYP